MSDKKWNPNQQIRSLWSSTEAEFCESDLELRVYSSRLLGQDSTLVLHGGGNTSVKVKELNLVGEEEEILYVKGSGWDLATIEKEGFAPVRLTPMQKLAKLKVLSDPEMVNELKTQMTLAGAPSPSVRPFSMQFFRLDLLIILMQMQLLPLPTVLMVSRE